MKNEKRKVGAPKKDNKKIQVNLVLPPDLVAWMRTNKGKYGSQPVIVETAIRGFYGVKKP